jgi:putative membrane protein
VTEEAEWHRLHPLSPVVRGGGVLGTLVVLLAIHKSSGSGGATTDVTDYALLGVAIVGSVVSWLVTRWRLDASTLIIESGLLRRRSRQLPLARIQAVDVVEPLLGKVFGLAELRVRLAGSSRVDGRLSYLKEPDAVELRTRLLAGQRKSEPESAPPASATLATVPGGRLVVSVLLGGTGAGFILIVAISLAIAKPAALAGSAFTWLIAVGINTWRRIRGEYGFKVSHVPAGLQVESGLLQTVTETIPRARIQALFRVEPLAWRPFGWSRLEVAVASGQSSGSGDGQSRRVTRALLPVGTKTEADELLAAVLIADLPRLTRPPRRAAFRSPLQYHFLASGMNDTYVVATTCRIRRRTAIIALAKAQSIRRVQGPIERRLGLASVFVDAAGRRATVEMSSRDVSDADALVTELTLRSGAARERPPVEPTTPVSLSDHESDASFEVKI